MKFLSKLFGKDEPDDADDRDEPLPWGEDDTYSAGGIFVEDADEGYECALGLPSSEAFPGYDERGGDNVWGGVEVNAEPDFETDHPPQVAAQHSENEWVSLRVRLQAEPRNEQLHASVRRAIPLRSERIEFYEELAATYQGEPYHSLSLARAYRAAGQNQDAVVSYQRYLRSVMDADAFEELADAYSSLGETYLAKSSQQIASSMRKKGDRCSNS